MFALLYVVALIYLTLTNGIIIALFVAPIVAGLAYLGLALVAELFYSIKKN